MLDTLWQLCSPLYLVLLLPPALYLLVEYLDTRKRRAFEVRYGVPYPSSPGFLTLQLKKLNMAEIQLEAVQRVGKVFGFNFLFKDTILVAHPELIQTVMSKEFTNFTNRRQFSTSDRVFKHAITSTVDETWKRQRAIITPTFATGKLRNMMPRVRIALRTLLNNVDESIDRANNAGELRSTGLNMKKLANTFTMDTIAQTAFGIELDSLKDPNNEIVTFGQKLFATDLTLKQLARFLIIFSMPTLANWFKMEFNPSVNRYFAGLVNKVLVEKREMLRKQPTNFRPTNFIELLLEAEAEYDKQNATSNGTKEDENKKAIKFMSNDEILAQCVLFFLAGFETTASTISIVLHELAMNEDAQDKVYEEIQTVLSTIDTLDENGNVDPVEGIDFNHLGKMPYLSAVVNESLRLHPPAPAVERQASKDIQLTTSDNSYTLNISKDDIIHVPVYALHYDDDNFTEAKMFRPERFIEPTHHNYAYLPFGQGPRNCVAKNFALMEVKLAVLNLVHRFKFSKCEATKHPVDIYFQNNVHTPKAVPLMVQRR